MDVSGKVQGVFFRDETRRVARSLGLVGMVRNMPDGTVHAVAEGPEEALDKLLAFCRRGPSAAVVEDVKYTMKEPTGTFDDFEIRR